MASITSTTGPSLQAPDYRLSVDGRDITRTIDSRLIRLSLTQCRGGEADELELQLDDSDGAIVLPRRGVQITLHLGWVGHPLVDKGTYTVDEIEHAGAPDTVTLRARAANLRGSLRERHEQSWHATTLGAIVSTIAGRNGLTARTDAALARIAIAHVDQSESDIALITRLAKRHDATATVKGGVLAVLPINGSRNSQGQAAPSLHITRASGDGHRYHAADRDAYSGVRAYWHDPQHAKQRAVLVGKSGNAKRLRESHATEADARAAAQAEWQRLQRGAATFSLDLALGLPQADAQCPLSVRGFRAEIDGTDWLITRVQHELGGSGYTTRIEAELQGTNGSAGTAADDPG